MNGLNRTPARALLVHNENAGTAPVARHAIERALHAAGIDTTYCDHGHDDLRTALAGDFDLVVAAGGDGTLADVVSTLDRVDRPVGVLPLGGSNNIAHALGIDAGAPGIAGDWRRIPALWSLERTMPLDRCEIDGSRGRKPFVEAVGAGALTRSFEQVDDEPDNPQEKRANGRAAFRAAVGEARAFACAIQAEAWSWEGECLLVEAMNTCFVGPRLNFARDGAAGDGLLDFVIVTPADRRTLMDWASAPDDAPCPIAPRQARWARLTVHGQALRVDDRCPQDDFSGTVDIRVRPDQARILVPSKEQA